MNSVNHADWIRVTPSVCLRVERESKVQGDSLKLTFLNVLLLGIKSHLRAVIIWKILLIGFHFDIRCEKVSNVMLKFWPLQFNYELNIWKYNENLSLTRSSDLLYKYLGPQIFLRNGSVLKTNHWMSVFKWDWPQTMGAFNFLKIQTETMVQPLKLFLKGCIVDFAWFLQKLEASMVGVSHI